MASTQVTCILLYIAFSMGVGLGVCTATVASMTAPAVNQMCTSGGYDSITSLVPLLTDAFERRGCSCVVEKSATHLVISCPKCVI